MGDIQIGPCFGGPVIEGNCDWVPRPCQDGSVRTEINTALSLRGTPVPGRLYGQDEDAETGK